MAETRTLTDVRCESLSEDGRRCHGDVGHPGTHWAAASRVWSDTETLVRPPTTSSGLDQASYDVGYEEGGSNREADWRFALSEYCSLPDDVEIDPMQVAAYIARLQADA